MRISDWSSDVCSSDLVVAQLAKEMGILTVAVVTKPFPFEGRRRMQVALKGIEELSHHCDSLITIPNEKLITVLGRNATMIQAFRAANRSAERRVGKEWVSPSRSGWSSNH